MSELSLKIQMYNANLTEETQQLNLQIKLVHTGSASVNLQDVKLRYYFTVDGEKAMAFDCWTSVGKENLTAHFIKMSSGAYGADYYLEIGFTSGAGVLSPGSEVNIASWFNKSDWSGFVQTNDYSFNPDSTAFVDWAKMTAYAAGTLRWGTEPAAAPTLPYPQNLQGNADETSITLTWSTVAEAAAYDLEADGTVLANLGSTTYLHSGLPIGSQHTYRVKAKNQTAESDWSPFLTVSTAEPRTLPSPSNLTAVPALASIALRWDPVAGAAGYDVEADGAVIDHVSGTSYTHGGLLPDTEHSYRVRAVNSVATGPWSAAAAARTEIASKIKVRVQTGVTPAISVLSPNFQLVNTGTEPANLSGIKFRYYFTVDGERPLSVGGYWTTPTDKQNVSARLVKMPIPSTLADHYLEIGFTAAAGVLQPGGMVTVGTWFHKDNWSNFDQTNDYSFNHSTEYAINDKAPGYISGVLEWGREPVLLDLPPFPDSIAAAPADTSILLSWDPVAEATSYEIAADGEMVTNLTDTTYTHAWLLPGTRHTYQIRTRQGGSVSVWSSPLTVKTTGGEILPAPRNVKALKTESSITVSWNATDEVATGYDIEVDGTVIDNGASLNYAHSGLTSGSLHTYRVRARNGGTWGTWTPLYPFNTIQVPAGTFNVSFHIDTSAGRAPISPYIYGSNDDLGGAVKWKSRRMGGNRMSTYNWENNASNAGDDYYFISDNYVPWYFGGVPWGGDMEKPAVGITGFHQKSLQIGAYTLTTLQTAGYAAKDKNGEVTQEETAPSDRWIEVQAAKGAPFSLTPDLTDGKVYMDELVHFLVNRFGNASAPTGIKGYSIDNEPGLWNKTHKFMHPEQPGSAEVLNKGIALAKAVKNIDPYAEMFGPVSYGFDEMLDMHASTDWKDVKGCYAWYTDYYLDKFRIASLKAGKCLLDVFDIHWYPETVGDRYRITDGQENDNLIANKARLQAPRQLWDPSYKDRSWIGDSFGSYLPLIPRLRQSIDLSNPNTKIAITEYNYGGENNVYGGIAQTDVLGIYGKYGVYLATLWKMFNGITDVPYLTAAFNLYTNYDGSNSTFGDTSVKTDTSDIENSSIYGSVFTDGDNNLHLIAINKNNDFDMNAVFTIAGETQYTSAEIRAFDSTSPIITARQPVASINGNSFAYTIPKLTACHIVLHAAAG